MNARGVGKTDVGQVRDSNEDAFHVDDTLGLYIVSDGMGGASAGEVASRLAIEVVARELGSARDDLVGLQSDPGKAAAVEGLLRAAFASANAAIQAEAQARPELRGMGCTLTAMVVAGTRAVVAHVGDSRAYVRADGELRQITADHTLAAEMVRAGALTPEVAAEHAYAHILTRAVGTRPSVEVDAVTVDLGPVDAILLCSDGLTDHADDTRWLVAQMASLELDAVPDVLITHANEAGGKDNITVVVVGMPPSERVVRRGLLGRIDQWLQKRDRA